MEWNPNEPLSLGLEWPPAQSGVSTIPGAIAQELISTVTETIRGVQIPVALSAAFGASSESLAAVLDVYDLATSPLADPAPRTEYLYPVGFSNRVDVTTQSGGTTNLDNVVDEDPVSNADYLVFPGLNDSVDLEFDSSAIDFTDRRIVSVTAEFRAHPNMVAGAHWEAGFMGGSGADPFGVDEVRTDAFTMSGGQTRRVDYGELNPAGAAGFTLYPWSETSIAGFDSAFLRIRLRRAGHTNPNQRISRVRLRIRTIPETRVAFGTVLSFGVIPPLTDVVEFVTDDGAAFWAKTTGTTYLLVLRRANSQPGGSFDVPWVEGGRPLPDGSVAYPTPNVSGDGALFAPAPVSPALSDAAALTAALGTARNRGYTMQPIVNATGVLSLDGQVYEFVSELPVYGAVDSGGQTLTTGAGGDYEWLRVVLRVDDPDLLPAEDLTAEIRLAATPIATAVFTPDMFDAADLLVPGQPTSPRELVAMLDAPVALAGATQYSVDFISATDAANPWRILGARADRITTPEPRTFGGATDNAYAGALVDDKNDFYTVLATVIDPVEWITAEAVAHAVDGGSVTGARCAVDEIEALEIMWAIPCVEPSPPLDPVTVTPVQLFSDDFSGPATVMDTTAGASIATVAGRHYFVYYLLRKDDENYYPGPVGTVTFTGGGLVFPADPVISPITVPPTSARRSDVYLARATADGLGDFVVTSSVAYSTGTLHVIEVADLYYDGDDYDCLGLWLNPLTPKVRLRAGVLKTGNSSETRIQMEYQEYADNLIMLFSARGDGTSDTADAPLTLLTPQALASNISTSVGYYQGRLDAPRTTHTNGSYLAGALELYTASNPPVQPIGIEQIGNNDRVPAANAGTFKALDGTSAIPVVAGTPVVVLVHSQRAATPPSAITSVASASNTWTLVTGADETFNTIATPLNRETLWVCDDPVTATENIVASCSISGQTSIAGIVLALHGADPAGAIVQVGIARVDAASSITASLPDDTLLDPRDSLIAFLVSDGENDDPYADGWRMEHNDFGVDGQRGAFWTEAGSGTRLKCMTFFRKNPNGDGTINIVNERYIAGVPTLQNRDMALIIAHVKAAPEVAGPLVEGFDHYELQRSDQVDEAWWPVAYMYDECTNTFTDLEARANVVSSYRVRIVRTDGTYSDWSPVATITRTQGAELAFTSNEDPALSLAYPDTYRPPAAERSYEFLDADTVELDPMMGRHGFHAEWPSESRGDRFTRTLLLNAKAQPVATLRSVNHYRPLRDLSRAPLPYVCVLDGDGGRWFANLRVPEGTVRQPGDMYFGQIGVVEVADRPWPHTIEAVP